MSDKKENLNDGQHPEFNDEGLNTLSKEELIKKLNETREWRDTYHDMHVKAHNELVDIKRVLDGDKTNFDKKVQG